MVRAQVCEFLSDEHINAVQLQISTQPPRAEAFDLPAAVTSSCQTPVARRCQEPPGRVISSSAFVGYERWKMKRWLGFITGSVNSPASARESTKGAEDIDYCC